MPNPRVIDASLVAQAHSNGISTSALWNRLKNGWDPEVAVSKKTRHSPRYKRREGHTATPASVPEKAPAPLKPLTINGTYEFPIQNKHKYKLDRIVKCAVGPLALFRITGTKALESFTAAQLIDEGYRIPIGGYTA